MSDGLAVSFNNVEEIKNALKNVSSAYPELSSFDRFHAKLSDLKKILQNLKSYPMKNELFKLDGSKDMVTPLLYWIILNRPTRSTTQKDMERSISLVTHLLKSLTSD